VSWDIFSVAKLEAGLVDALFDNCIAAIRVPNFLDDRTVRTAAESVEKRGIDYYAGVSPPIGKIGITQFEYRHSEQSRIEYFSLAAAANKERSAIFTAGSDPVILVMEAIRAARPAGLAIEGDGSQYFAGLIRVINETLIHCDWAPFDASSWTIGKINAQITWNIYCQMPDVGGTITVYNRPWTPATQRFQIPGSYGYREELIAGCESIEIQPMVGDLLFFNSRNPHRVNGGAGAMRISVSSFVGRGDGESLVLWS
jgi:hypothetical protein